MPPSSAEQRIRLLLQERQAATRPQLAATTGLSLVTVGHIVRRLVANGEITGVGTVPSGGGRPVQLYRYRADYAYCALFEMQRRENLLHGHLQWFDLQGRLRGQEQARFAQLHEASLDDWLDNAQRKKPLQRISLFFPTGESVSGLVPHLEQRYHCPVCTLSPALALADGQEQTLTLCLLRQQRPTAAWRLHGNLCPAGALWQLPMPVTWESLPYDDHTLVEEMTARLTATLCCTLAPIRVVLYADFWTQRLTTRIRYNLSTKLRAGTLPTLSFRTLTPMALKERIWRAAIRGAGGGAQR